jgi:predicted Zn-dependent peptidase
MKKTSLFVLVLVVVVVCYRLFSTSVVRIFHSENNNGSYIVVVKMAPKNITEAIDFWLKNKTSILSKTEGLNYGKYILFVKNEFESKSDDDLVQLCLPKQIKDGDICINYSSRLFTIVREKENGMGLYSITQEDVYLKNDDPCMFFDYDNGKREYLGCHNRTE